MSFYIACCVHKIVVSVAGSVGNLVGQTGHAGYVNTSLTREPLLRIKV